jgi:hypothetical protein
VSYFSEEGDNEYILRLGGQPKGAIWGVSVKGVKSNDGTTWRRLYRRSYERKPPLGSYQFPTVGIMMCSNGVPFHIWYGLPL